MEPLTLKIHLTIIKNIMIGTYNFKNLNHSSKILNSLVDDHRAADNMMMKVLLAH